MRHASVLLLVMLVIGGLAAAQAETATPDATATALILGPINVVTPTATPIPADDPRPAICSAPFQPGFTAHMVRAGERLADLMVGVLTLTVTQVAALNCVDDASSLPVGAVIWLPEANTVTRAEPNDATPGVDRAIITRIKASRETMQNLETVSFRWAALGSAAYFYLCNPDPTVECVRPASAQPVPLSYSTPDIGGFRYAGAMRYRLEVVDGNASATQDITIQVTCSQVSIGQYTGLLPCPDEPHHSVTAALQPFQGGMMIWFSDTRQIWALMQADNRVQVFNDLYHDGDPETTLTAAKPDGLYMPMRGFGRVWGMLGGSEALLGWATAPESGVDITQQPAGRVSYTVYMQPQGGAVLAVTLLPGERSGWWMVVE